MTAPTCPRTREIVETILKRHSAFEVFQYQNSFHLSFEILKRVFISIEKQNDLVSITQETRIAEETVRHLEMRFETGKDESWRVVSMQLAVGSLREAIIYCEGKRWLDPVECDELTMSCETWARAVAEEIS